MRGDTDQAITEEAASDLMNLLISRGYIHDHTVDPLQEITGGSLEDMIASQAETPPLYQSADLSCRMIPTRDGRYLTKQKFVDLFNSELLMLGRLSTSDAATVMGVPESVIQQTESDMPDVLHVGDEWMTSRYIDELVERDVNARIVIQGQVSVSELASQVFGLPMDFTLIILEDRLTRGLLTGKLCTLFGAKTLISTYHEETERRRVCGAFLACSSPTSVDTLCSAFHWDKAVVLPVLRGLCDSEELPGELHESGSSSAGAMYIPTIYLTLQRQSISDFFLANGYISAAESQSRGILPSNMGAFVMKLFPSATELETAVINVDVVVSPLEAVLMEAISASSFVDLCLHLPQQLMANPGDVKYIVNEIALVRIAEAGEEKSARATGVTVAADGDGIFISSGMIRRITKGILPASIEVYGKLRAKELDSSPAPPVVVEEDADVSRRQSGREKRRSKKTGKRGDTSVRSIDAMQYGTVPLVVVAAAVAKEYPDLVDMQQAHSRVFTVGDEDEPFWEITDTEGSTSDGPLYSVCRQVVFTDDFQASCRRSIEAELKRLRESKKAISIRSRKDGAAKTRSVESSFEDPSCFAAACYALQEHAKFIHFVTTCDMKDEVLLELKQDFLAGIGVDFVGRITQFCLFKNEVEDGIFLVSTKGEPREESDLPRCCRPFKKDVRRYPTTFLSCSDGDGGKASSPPLVALRESLSGGVGVSLARAWTHCGGQCYDGGIKRTEDGEEYVRPGDVDGLLELLEDSCLSICGLPFKKLDKKSEKQFLLSRRQELTRALESATDADTVLELSIMLLFQQVKNLVVAGACLTGPVLDLLAKERKMTDEASCLLRKVADAVRSGEEVDNSLVSAVKACGLSRDISKHVIGNARV